MRRRILASGALVALTAVFLPVSAPGAAITPAAAQEASAAAVTPFSGAGGASLIDVEAALAGTPIVDLGLTPVDTTVDTSATARSEGRVVNLEADLLGSLSLDGILSEAVQSAPPDNEQPAEAVLLPLDLSPPEPAGLDGTRPRPLGRVTAIACRPASRSCRRSPRRPRLTCSPSPSSAAAWSPS